MTFRSWTAGIAVLGALAAGAVANRAALRAPLEMDDVAQRAMIEGTLTPRRGPFNLYDFVADDNRAALMERGVIPWWSDPHLVTRFLRPLPSVLVWLDHRLFGYDAFGPHLLSLLWWVGAVLAAHMLYRRTLGPGQSLAATVVFALSPTLAIPLVWAANRNVIVTVTFGAFALALYTRWRDDRRRGQGIATAAAFTATALTGEYALCLIGYLVAFELCRRAEPAGRRLTGALPALVPFVIYAVARAALGYGAMASGFYRDPTADSSAYVDASAAGDLCPACRVVARRRRALALARLRRLSRDLAVGWRSPCGGHRVARAARSVGRRSSWRPVARMRLGACSGTAGINRTFAAPSRCDGDRRQRCHRDVAGDRIPPRQPAAPARCSDCDLAPGEAAAAIVAKINAAVGNEVAQTDGRTLLLASPTLGPASRLDLPEVDAPWSSRCRARRPRPPGADRPRSGRPPRPADRHGRLGRRSGPRRRALPAGGDRRRSPGRDRLRGYRHPAPDPRSDPRRAERGPGGRHRLP